MDRAAAHLQAMVPALLFLSAGVPLAALLDQLGFFDSVAMVIERRWSRIPVAALWWLTFATTAVLNLDTTVVLLTPLYVRLARRSGVDPLPVAIIPLLLASFASSVLPVSNLTTLIATDRYGLSVGDVVVHLAPVSVAASVVGWLVYRRRHPTTLPSHGGGGEPDARALWLGGATVTFLLVGFVVGPTWGVAPWVVAVVADVALMALTRSVPWREIPVATGVGVSLLAGLTAVVVPAGFLGSLVSQSDPGALAGVTLLGAALANAVNNLPALLVAIDSSDTMSWGLWAWLAGVNTGAALLPLGALANLLWWRILRAEALDMSVGRYARATVPVVLPALLAGAVTLATGHVLIG